MGRTELFIRSGSHGFRLVLPRGASGSARRGVGRLQCDYYLTPEARPIGQLMGQVAECFVGFSDGRGAPWSSPVSPLRTPNRSGVLFLALVEDLGILMSEADLVVGRLHLRRIDEPQWCWKVSP